MIDILDEYSAIESNMNEIKSTVILDNQNIIWSEYTELKTLRQRPIYLKSICKTFNCK